MSERRFEWAGWAPTAATTSQRAERLVHLEVLVIAQGCRSLGTTELRDGAAGRALSRGRIVGDRVDPRLGRWFFGRDRTGHRNAAGSMQRSSEEPEARSCLPSTIDVASVRAAAEARPEPGERSVRRVHRDPWDEWTAVASSSRQPVSRRVRNMFRPDTRVNPRLRPAGLRFARPGSSTSRKGTPHGATPRTLPRRNDAKDLGDDPTVKPSQLERRRRGFQVCPPRTPERRPPGPRDRRKSATNDPDARDSRAGVRRAGPSVGCCRNRMLNLGPVRLRSSGDRALVSRTKGRGFGFLSGQPVPGRGSEMRGSAPATRMRAEPAARGVVLDCFESSLFTWMSADDSVAARHGTDPAIAGMADEVEAGLDIDLLKEALDEADRVGAWSPPSRRPSVSRRRARHLDALAPRRTRRVRIDRAALAAYAA
ncbi:hypothetical protein FQR65_LT20460 [Abscondita terminalis]|nr:hypothetical protein FQR65_LT20460 [Abscondita terminalis]